MTREHLIGKLMDVQERCLQVVHGDEYISAQELSRQILEVIKR